MLALNRQPLIDRADQDQADSESVLMQLCIQVP